MRRLAGGRSAPQAAERRRQLAGDHPDLVRVALRDLRQHLQVLVGEQLRVGVPVVDRLEDGADRLRLSLGGEDRGLLLPLRLEDRRLLLALGGQDLRLLDPLGLQDRRPLLAVGPHLLLHRVLDRRRRVDGLQLDAMDPDAPLAGRLVEDAAQLVVDRLARRERLLERHPADHVAQRGDGEQVDRVDGVRDLVRRRLRVGDLEVDDRVDVDDEVVLGDHRLRLERDRLLAQVEQRLDAIDERDDKRQSRRQRARVAAEALDDAGPRLRDHANRLRERDENEEHDHSEHDQSGSSQTSYSATSAVAPSIWTTSTVVPSANTSSSRYERALHSSPPMRTRPPWRSTRRVTRPCGRPARRCRSGTAPASGRGGARSGAG